MAAAARTAVSAISGRRSFSVERIMRPEYPAPPGASLP